MDNVRTGGCSCGAVRFALKGEPFKLGLCHCTTCRKASGSMFVAYALWPLSASQVEGEVKTFEGRSFCPNCGSRLFELHDNDIEVTVGTLDDAPTGLTPTVEIWVKRREHWLAPVQGASQHEENPPRA
jgi:hypothetical protein